MSNIAEVTQKMSYQEYSEVVKRADNHSPLKMKIPMHAENILPQNSGYCFYFFGDELTVLPNLHLKGAWDKPELLEHKISYDLEEDIILSDNFVYFGNNFSSAPECFRELMSSLPLTIGSFDAVALSEHHLCETQKFLDTYSSCPIQGYPCLNYRLDPSQSAKELPLPVSDNPTGEPIAYSQALSATAAASNVVVQ